MTDREKLVELLKRTEYQFTVTHSLTVENVADDLIQHGVTFAKDNDVPTKWISIKDRLPDEDCYCLIYTTVYFTPDHYDEPDHYNSVEKSYYSTQIGFMGTHGIYAKAWMPLPEPPKEE